MEIYLTSKDLDPDTLIDKLENTPEWQSQQVQLILRKKPQAFRFLDPTIVVAIISAAGTGLTALITGVLALAKEAKSQHPSNEVLAPAQEPERGTVPTRCATS